MELTPQELRALRDVAVRAVDEAYGILVAAARRAALEQGSEERSRQARSAVDAALSRVEDDRKLTFTVKEASAALGISRATLTG